MSADTELRLSYAVIDVKPVDYDWSEGYPETWEFHEARECEQEHTLAHAIQAAEEQDIDPDDVQLDDVDELFVTTRDECPGCEAELYQEGPMMSYYYPVELGDVEEAAKKLVHSPLCVVTFESGDEGLALTGGGMDLSWEICEAFIKLGFYPPAHFCSLPRMAGRGTSEGDLKIVRACLESVKAMQLRAGYGRERLEEMLEEAGVDVDG